MSASSTSSRTQPSTEVSSANTSTYFSFPTIASRFEEQGCHCPTPSTINWAPLTKERAVNVLSTAHRADGQIVPRHKLVGTKTQRELSPKDLGIAVQSEAAIAQHGDDFENGIAGQGREAQSF